MTPIERGRRRRAQPPRLSSQKRTARGKGRIRGLVHHGDAIVRRIENVARRAEFTQPERRIVEIRRFADVVEVQTTSQKLAHRVVRELEQAFGGRGHFEWSDRDGRLYATWGTQSAT